MRKAIIAGLCLYLAACQDNRGQEDAVIKRCEALLAAQELTSLPPALRGDPRAPIRPKGDPRINNSATGIFVRRSYDRLVGGDGGTRIEARDYTCIFDKATDRISSLMTNGHQQEFRLNDEEFAIMRKGGKPE